MSLGSLLILTAALFLVAGCGGPERAPHRSYYYAMGLSREQIHQPFVGMATCWNEAAPCNIALMR